MKPKKHAATSIFVPDGHACAKKGFNRAADFAVGFLLL
jgi:hypothetical protein